MKNTNNPNKLFFNLAITKAQDISTRASIGWALFDDDNNMLHYDACMAGLEAGKLESNIRQYGQQAAALYISSEPNDLVFNTTALGAAIEDSSINMIHVGKNFNGAATNQNWRDWQVNWPGEVTKLPINAVFEKMSLGIENIQKFNRPWVTTFSAATLAGRPEKLVAHIGEFDFLNYLIKLTKQSRALLYAQSQLGMLDHLPTKNNEGEMIEKFEVYDEKNIPGIMCHLAKEVRGSVLILADVFLLDSLLTKNCVDEVIHHISNGPNDKTVEPAQLDLTQWRLKSSSVVGACNRVVYRKQDYHSSAKQGLGSRLN